GISEPEKNPTGLAQEIGTQAGHHAITGQAKIPPTDKRLQRCTNESVSCKSIPVNPSWESEVRDQRSEVRNQRSRSDSFFRSSILDPRSSIFHLASDLRPLTSDL